MPAGSPRTASVRLTIEVVRLGACACVASSVHPRAPSGELRGLRHGRSHPFHPRSGCRPLVHDGSRSRNRSAQAVCRPSLSVAHLVHVPRIAFHSGIPVDFAPGTHGKNPILGRPLDRVIPRPQPPAALRTAPRPEAVPSHRHGDEERQRRHHRLLEPHPQPEEERRRHRKRGDDPDVSKPRRRWPRSLGEHDRLHSMKLGHGALLGINQSVLLAV
jgi:hypothetical protein